MNISHIRHWRTHYIMDQIILPLFQRTGTGHLVCILRSSRRISGWWSWSWHSWGICRYIFPPSWRSTRSNIWYILTLRTRCRIDPDFKLSSERKFDLIFKILHSMMYMHRYHQRFCILDLLVCISLPSWRNIRTNTLHILTLRSGCRTRHILLKLLLRAGRFFPRLRTRSSRWDRLHYLNHRFGSWGWRVGRCLQDPSRIGWSRWRNLRLR